MTDKEFEMLAVALKAAYPNSNVLPDKYALKTWYRSLADIDFQVAENAVWEHINTSVFPPSIAEIREKCANRLYPMITDWGEAWEEVQRAIRKYGSYREVEAIESLSRLTATVVRRMGFLNICQSDNPVADRAHFQRLYEGLVEKERNLTQLPGFVRVGMDRMIEENAEPPAQLLEKVKDNVGLPAGELASQQHIGKLVAGVKEKLGIPTRKL